MSPDGEIDDETIDALVRGEGCQGAQLSHLVAFARQVQEIGDVAAPAPSVELRYLLEGRELVVIDLVQVDRSSRSAELASVAAPVAGPLAATEQARQTRGALGASPSYGQVVDHEPDPSPARLDDEPRHLRDRPDRWFAWESLLGKLDGLGRRYRVVVAAVAVVVLVVASALVEMAPPPVNDVVRTTVTSITPFDLSADSDDEGEVSVEIDAESETEPPTSVPDDERGAGEARPEQVKPDAATEVPDHDPGEDQPADVGGVENRSDATEPAAPPEVPDSPAPTSVPPQLELPVPLPDLGFDIPFVEDPSDNASGNWSDYWP